MDSSTWIEEAEELYKKGMSYTKIGENLKVDRKKVSLALREKGYSSNLKYYPNLESNAYRKYDLNDDVFEVIDTEEKAYWLGFLYADGSVSKDNNVIDLALKESDKEHLYRYKEFLSYEGKVVKKNKKTETKIYNGYRVSFSSKKMKQDLIKHGCTPRKTKTLTYPSKSIPTELERHFIRGYIDGDGSITYANSRKQISLEIIGTENFLLGCISYFKKLGVFKSNINVFNHSDIKRYMISGQQALVILNDIYKDSSIHLERKYARYAVYR